MNRQEAFWLHKAGVLRTPMHGSPGADLGKEQESHAFGRGGKSETGRYSPRAARSYSLFNFDFCTLTFDLLLHCRRVVLPAKNELTPPPSRIRRVRLY